MGYLSQLLSQSKALAVEAIGTFLLVAVGTSAITTLNVSGQGMSAPLLLLNILAFSLTFGWLVYIFNDVKTGYFNPAITIFLWLRGSFTLSAAAALVLVQLASAILASIAVALMYGTAAVVSDLGAVYPATEMGAMGAVIAEACGMVIVLAMIVKTVDRPVSAVQRSTLLASSLAIGQLLSIGVSGGALNPARAIAPQLAIARVDDWWVYWLGPAMAVGAVWLGQRWLVKPQAQPSQSISKATAAANDPVQQQNLQEKARQALVSLRRQAEPSSHHRSADVIAEDEPAVPVDTVAQNTAPDLSPSPAEPPLQPTFSYDDEGEEPPLSSAKPSQSASPSTPHAVRPTRPTAVSFVNFDTPVDTTADEDEK